MLSRKYFVDIQVNGYMGADFSADGITLDDVRKVTEGLAEKGTVAYCPTICTSPMETYRSNLQVLAEAMSDPELGGHILGIHLEGPFISPKPGAVGAHRVDCVRRPSVEDFDKFQKWSGGNIRILTMAPEEPGAEELIRHASGQGVVVMFGHQLADREVMERGLAAGAKGATHVGNGLPNEIHRHQNPIWWQLACDDIWGSFVTDGHHLPPDFIKVALRAKTLERFIVTSDAAPLAGMPAGVYDGFGKQVQVHPSGRLNVYGTEYLAGSHSTMFECMNYLASLGLLDEEGLFRVSFDNPLKLFGMTAEALSGVEATPVSFDGMKFSLD